MSGRLGSSSRAHTTNPLACNIPCLLFLEPSVSNKNKFYESSEISHNPKLRERNTYLWLVDVEDCLGGLHKEGPFACENFRTLEIDGIQ